MRTRSPQRLFAAVSIVAANLIVDLVTLLLDPRIQREG